MPLSVGSLAMSLAVYLGSTAPLPLVAWDVEHRGFHVDAIDETREQDLAVRRRLGTPGRVARSIHVSMTPCAAAFVSPEAC
jgi:hypothetical protein